MEKSIENLTKARLELLNWMATAGVTGLLPYSWNSGKTQVVYKPTRLRNIGVIINATLQFVFVCFVLLRWFQSLDNDNWTVSQKARIQASLMFSSVTFLGYLKSIANNSNYEVIYHGLLSLQLNLQDAPSLAGKPWKILWVIRFMRVMTTLAILTNPLANLVNPSHPATISSLANNPQELSTGTKVLLYCVQLLMANGVWTPTFLFGAVTAYYCYCMKNSLLQLSLKKASALRPPKTQILHPAEIQKRYNLLRVLEAAVQSCSGNWIFAYTALGIVVMIIGIYEAICFHNLRTAVVSAVVFLSMYYMLQNGDQVHFSAVQILQSWTLLDQQPAWFHKYRSACRPLRVSVGSIFYYDRSYFLTFLNIVLSNAAAAILYHSSTST